MEEGSITTIILFLVILLIDMFFYGFGSASSAINKKEVEKRAQEKGDIASKRLLRIVSLPSGYINTMTLIVTTTNIFAGVYFYWGFQMPVHNFLNKFLYTSVFEGKIPEYVTAVISNVTAMLLMLYILLTFGILLPKLIAAKVSEKWCYFFVTPVTFLMIIFNPITAIVTATAHGVMFLLGFRNPKQEADITEEELINLVQEGHEQGVLQEDEAMMISNIFELDDKEAQHIMTHRNNIVAIDSKTRLSVAIDFMLKEKNSRYPVYEENIDHIIGILNIKDACRYRMKHKDSDKMLYELPGIMREPVFVAQTKSINELFRQMQSSKTQMVIVVDEYGQTDGLVAMEDILEEIVGNIQDEFDEERTYIKSRGINEYIMEGKTPLEELEDSLGINFDQEQYETLNGFMISKLEHIPAPDEKFECEYQGYRFKILSVKKKMVETVLVKKVEEESPKILESIE